MKISRSWYKKLSNTNIYIYSNSLEPKSWKRGILRRLPERAYLICFTLELLDSELKHITSFL